MTSAVAMLVAGVLRSSTIGPISTGSALTLKDIWICARTMTIKASHGALSESCALGVSTGSVSVVNELPFHAVPRPHRAAEQKFRVRPPSRGLRTLKPRAPVYPDFSQKFGSEGCVHQREPRQTRVHAPHTPATDPGPAGAPSHLETSRPLPVRRLPAPSITRFPRRCR